MANWVFNPADYAEKEFTIIPAGDHRVRIYEVIKKTFASGRSGYEVTLEVSSYSSKLWYYLVFDENDPKKTNQRLGSFFDSFGITDYNLDHHRAWVGKIGAVRVKHEEYNGANTAKVAFCLARKNQDKLDPWKGDTATATASSEFVEVPEDDLPF